MEGMTPTAEDVPLELAVIIPAHNVEDTLAEQLNALVTQTWAGRWGIVVVNNRSTDDTLALAESYMSRGVRVVDATAQAGPSYARNYGVLSVNATSFAFCDGDDVVHPGWVSAMGDALRTASIVSGPLETNSLNPSWLARTRPMAHDASLPTFGSIGFLSGCNCAITREAFELLGGFDEGFVGNEDIELSLRALAQGFRIEFEPRALIAYRLRDGLPAVWKQGLYYGRGRPELKRRARRQGLTAPPVGATLKSWMWLLVHLPGLRTKTGRFRWVWVLANRIGVVHGHVDRLRLSMWPW